MPEEFHNYRRRAERAYRQVDTGATQAQRDALRQRVGRLHVHGLDLRIEYPPGSTRTGTGPDGKTWSRKMVAAYGRIKRTVGRDGEPVDVFLGPDLHSQLVFVITQLDDEGNTDEHKCVLGCHNYQQARDLYLAHYPSGWADTRLGEIRGFTTRDFKEWLKTDAPRKNKARKQASFAEEILGALSCLSPTA